MIVSTKSCLYPSCAPSFSHEIQFTSFASIMPTILAAGSINYTALDVLVCLFSLMVKWTVPFFLFKCNYHLIHWCNNNNSNLERYAIHHHFIFPFLSLSLTIPFWFCSPYLLNCFQSNWSSLVSGRKKITIVEIWEHKDILTIDAILIKFRNLYFNLEHNNIHMNIYISMIQTAI